MSHKKILTASHGYYFGLFLVISILTSAMAAAANFDGVIGSSNGGGTLYRYSNATQSVTPISGGWGSFEQMVGLDDGRALFGATASGGTLGVATAASGSSVTTGLGSFQVMTAIDSGGAGHAVYGTTAGSGSVGGYNGATHGSTLSGLTAGGGTFTSVGDLGDGNALIGTAGGSLNGALRKVNTSGALVQTGGDGWGSVTQIAGLPGNDQAFVGTTFNQRVYHWNDSPSYVGGGVTSGWGTLEQLIPVSSTQFLLGASFGSGTVTVRNSANAATVTEGGWIGFETAVPLTNGDAFVGTQYAGGSPMLYDASAGDTYGVGGNNWGTFQQMIGLDNGFALWGSDVAGGVDGEYLGLWDGTSVVFDDNGGLGWGNFELLFDLGMGEALIGTDAAGGTLYLAETDVGSLNVTTIGTGLGSFQAGAAVTALVPEPTSIAIWSLLGLCSLGIYWHRGRNK